jgi:hypothetical protein
MLETIRQRVQDYLLGSVCFILIGAGTLLAQGTAGTITGVVTDPTGAVIPQTDVTVTNQGTGVDFHLRTNNAGMYSITSLLPGTYTVSVAQKGFKTYVNKDLALSINQVLRVDVQLEIGTETQTVTVEAQAPLVNTEEGRLSSLVTASQIQSMPLNGRNIYQLMQLIPGAVNSTGINLENADSGGISTNVNGMRLNFNGFLLDGVANKGLTGGSNAQPSPDFVQEFRVMTNDFSAQYGNSAGSITDVSIKSGTNSLHGAAWEYLRNDALNARNFFDGETKSLWRQNQFGVDLGGPIKKDKLFFFAGYEGERFRTEYPAEYTIETPEWRQAVSSTFPNSVAALLYKDFPGPTVRPEDVSYTVADVVDQTALYDLEAPVGDEYASGTMLSNSFMAYTDPCLLNYWNYIGAPAYTVGSIDGPNWGDAQTIANKFASLVGVDSAENAQIQANINAACPGMGFVAPGVQSGAIARDAWMLGTVRAKVPTQRKDQFYNGNQYVGRIDYQGDKARLFGRFIQWASKNPNLFNQNVNSGVRGFLVPETRSFPSAAFGFVYSFSPAVVNEFRAGYTRNQISDVPTPSQFGVPFVGFDFGEVQFGAYNGYPQFFVENVYNYADMVGIVKGKHSLKLGGEFKRNIENSEFNVGRPSYYFLDMLYFAADLPYFEGAGVNPELTTGGSAHIDTNIRAWRNYELGFYVQDDWKATKNLTLNFGFRWDYFSPLVEKYGKITNFNLGPGLAQVNCQAYAGGKCLAPTGDTNTPNGGFIVANRLTPPDKNNFSPRFGFAWDVRGNGKTALRGGFAVSYEAGIYNPLANSRWNMPFYAFDMVQPIWGSPGLPVYGPMNPDGTPNTTATPTYSGPPTNPGQGPAGLGFAGNLMGWYSGSPHMAYYTGIPDPVGMRTPYVESGFLGIQHEVAPNTVLEVNWVGTFGKKLFWAENPNRVVGGMSRDPSTLTNPCTGDTLSTPTGLLNPCFGSLRTWENTFNSNYNALQLTLTRKMSQGLAFTSSYTWSHALDFRSSWHAATSGGSADWPNPYGSSGYSLDPNRLYLEYGNSSFDVRQRWVASVVWELPWLKDQHGAAGKILGGWQTNYNVALQSGLPFTVGARRDYNGDGIKSDRPDTPSFGNHYSFKNTDFLAGSAPGGGSVMQGLLGDFPDPATGTDGNLGRNTFRGPGMATVDFSLFKKISITERVSAEFRAEFFNLFNRVNLYQPDANLYSANFGLSMQAFDPRLVQFGLRFAF